MKKPDIDLYKDAAEDYERLQYSRPDYQRALKAFKSILMEHANDLQSALNVADFCCGTGENTLSISNERMLGKAMLIDINEKFLEIALSSGIKAKQIETQATDILRAKLEREYDLVISMFAYHHVPDDAKEAYLKAARSALKDGGIMILGEIFVPNKESTLRYYQDVLGHVPDDLRTPELDRFLMQTAESNDFEYKASKRYAYEQLERAGFKLIRSTKVWPEDGSMGEDTGMFVETWQI